MMTREEFFDPEVMKRGFYLRQAYWFGERAARRLCNFSIVDTRQAEIDDDVARLARIAGHFARMAMMDTGALDL